MRTHTVARPRALRDPVDILEQLLRIASEHFAQVPALLTTDRRGRFESGWARTPDGLMPIGNKQLPLADKQRNQVHMAALVTEYADHPRATPELIDRSRRFPASIALALRPSR